MAHAENEITIDRAATEVYAFLADGLNNPAWRRSVQSIALRSGAPGETGAVYGQTLTGPRGRPIQGDYRITAADPGRTLASRSLPARRARKAGTC
ncbi:SRPBCC family protein [Pseudarthrobacter sp. S9]|uniref:SRPBCC family protein n=1 Tax=Pseudarthrobacter sp. S9 TaxID=3418421 RepID=UPI003D0429C0